MLRIIAASALLLLLAAGCASASAAFQPNTSLEPTLGPTPAGLAAATPAPPVATGTVPPTETAVPTLQPNAPTPTNTPTNTPTVLPAAIMISVTDKTVAPSQVTLTAGKFIRLIIQNQGSGEYEFQVLNLKPDDVTADESLAGSVSSDQLSTVDDDAGNGKIHLFAKPQGAASVTFTPAKKGTFPFTITINGQQLTGNVVVQ